MVLDIGWILLGLLLLVFGGDALVRGASGIAQLARITPAVIGLTIVAAGTSMPELVVSLQSAFRGSPGIAIGNIVGSNIFNIGMIVGLAALVRPLRIQSNTIRMEWPIMMLASFQLFLLARDGLLDRMEGSFLVTALVCFIAYAVYVGRRDSQLSEEVEAVELTTASFGRTGGAALTFNLLAILLGIGLLAGGSSALVEGAVNIARGLGVSETVVGLTIVAAGTSTPELLTSLVASKRGQDDIAVGNVVGSNIFNILCIGGLTGLIHPLDVSSDILGRDMFWMLGFSVVLFPLMKSGLRIVRAEGALLFVGFLVYIGVLVQATVG